MYIGFQINLQFFQWCLIGKAFQTQGVFLGLNLNGLFLRKKTLIHIHLKKLFIMRGPSSILVSGSQVVNRVYMSRLYNYVSGCVEVPIKLLDQMGISIKLVSSWMERKIKWCICGWESPPIRSCLVKKFILRPNNFEGLRMNSFN